MNYEYYKIYYDGDICRIDKNNLGSEFIKVEWYRHGSWKQSSISNKMFINFISAMKITKEEAFMELI